MPQDASAEQGPLSGPLPARGTVRLALGAGGSL